MNGTIPSNLQKKQLNNTLLLRRSSIARKILEIYVESVLRRLATTSLLFGMGDISIQDSHERSAMHVIPHGSLLDTKTLLSDLMASGPKSVINFIDAEDRTALHRSTLFDDSKYAKILLQNDARLSLINFNNPTRLDHTSKKGHIDCIRALLNHSPDITSPRALRFAARTGELFSVKLLMDLGACPWAVDGRGSNALHQAALSSSEKVVKTILEGPKFELANSLDANNCNALHYSTDSP